MVSTATECLFFSLSLEVGGGDGCTPARLLDGTVHLKWFGWLTAPSASQSVQTQRREMLPSWQTATWWGGPRARHIGQPGGPRVSPHLEGHALNKGAWEEIAVPGGAELGLQG